MLIPLRLLFVFLLISLSTAWLPAQTANATLIVNLTDQLGSIIPGAEITLIAADSAKIKHKSNDNGVAEFRRIAAGHYQIIIKVAGFKEHKNDDIILQAGETRKLDVALELAAIESQVSVDADSGTDMSGYGATKSLSEKQIETLPDDPDALGRVLQRMAGESVTGEQLPVTVNGMPGAPMPSKENIKLVRVNRNIFSAQYENTYGGGIEIFTNSGGKKLSGFFGAGYSDSRFNATDPFLGSRVPSRSESFNYGISGPIRKNMSISINGYRSQDQSSAVINATVLDQALHVVDLRQTVKTPGHYDSVYISLDSDLNKQHKLYVLYSGRFNNTQNSGVGNFTLASRADISQNFDHTINASDTYIVNPNLVIVTRFITRLTKSRTVGDLTNPSINVSEAFMGGGSQNDRTSSVSRYELYNDTTKKINRFSVGFGFMVRGQSLSETSRSNFGGAYSFNGRVAPVLDANNQPVKDAAGNIVTSQITSLESYRRTLFFRQQGLSGAQTRAAGGGADQFTIAGGQPTLSVKQADYAFYQQNSYSLTETLGISFGVRYENQTNIDSKFNISPRLGFIWSPKEKEKQKPITVLPKVTIGYGFFYSRFAANNTLSALQANDESRLLFFVTDPAVLDIFPAVPSLASLGASSTPRSLRLIAPGLQSPRQNLFNASVNKKLWRGFSVYFNYSHSHGYRQAVLRNINAPISPVATVPVYPFGTSRSIYETRSIGQNRTDRISASLGFPEWKMKGSTDSSYFYLSYSFARTRNNGATGSSSPLDPYDFSREWSPGTSDGVHQINGYSSIGLPHGFNISANYQISSGYRFNITTGRDTNKDGFYYERPAFATNLNKPGVVMTPYGALDPNPLPGDNIIPRNLARGPIFRNVDLYFSKSFGFRKDKANKNLPTQRLRFSVSVNNFFNINNKGTPIGNMSSPNFLRTLSGYSWDAGSLSASNPRSLSFRTGYSF